MFNHTTIVVMGVSGSGKTTIATLLAAQLGWPYAEADDFHLPANVEKMANGVPLTDEDRWPWLHDIRAWIGDAAAQGQSTVITCSALKRTYRDALASPETNVFFIHLHDAPELLRARMKTRSGHFMPESLLASQLDTLEALHEDEHGILINNVGSPEQVVEEITTKLTAVLGQTRPGVAGEKPATVS